MDDIPSFISDYLDGELDDPGVERLAESLRHDPATVDQLVLSSFIHSQLSHWLNVRQMRDEILADAFIGVDVSGRSPGQFEEVVAAERAAGSAADGSAPRLAGRRRPPGW